MPAVGAGSKQIVTANPVCLALDVNNFESGKLLLRKLGRAPGAIKIGPRLLLREGPTAARHLSEVAPLFIDFKFNDIPSTTVEAVRAAFDLGASFVTVHASIGLASLKQIKDLESELNQVRPFLVLAVTVLTSYTEHALPSVWQKKPISQLVGALVQDVCSAGLSGVVCSPNEVASLRKTHPELYLVTPGIRFGSSAMGDQARVASPKAARDAGSNLLVIGRLLLDATEPSRVFDEILKELGDPQ